jgi:hypothetical protein
VWRDPSRDFGLDVLTLHHRLHHDDQPDPGVRTRAGGRRL